jgi:hypothetical protein
LAVAFEPLIRLTAFGDPGTGGRVAHSSLPWLEWGSSRKLFSPMDDNVVYHAAQVRDALTSPTQAKTGLEWATNPITSYVAILNTVGREVILSGACRSENPQTGPVP